MSRSVISRAGRCMRHVSRRAAVLVALVALHVNAYDAAAQAVSSAALFLMQPMGARSVGHGETSVADTLLGTEGLWWNPAGMARIRKSEFGVHGGQANGATTTLLSVATPSRALGTIAAGYYLLAYPDQAAIDEFENPEGIITSRYHMLTAGYGTPMGKRFSAGVTVKYIFIRVECGGCFDTRHDQKGKVGAADFGAQYVLPTKFPLTLGGSVRNLSLNKLRARDAEQADELPRIYQFGAQSRLPIAALAKNQTTLDVMGDVLISPEAYDQPSLRFGAELSYQNNYTLRAGYKSLSATDGVEKGLTAGVGFKYNSFQVDLARRFDKSGAISESIAPTYVTLRVIF